MWGVVLVDVCRVLVLFCFCVVCVCVVYGVVWCVCACSCVCLCRMLCAFCCCFCHCVCVRVCACRRVHVSVCACVCVRWCERFRCDGKCGCFCTCGARFGSRAPGNNILCGRKLCARVHVSSLLGPPRAPECARFKTLLYSPERAPLGFLCFVNKSGPQRAPEVPETGAKRTPEGPNAVKLTFPGCYRGVMVCVCRVSLLGTCKYACSSWIVCALGLVFCMSLCGFLSCVVHGVLAHVCVNSRVFVRVRCARVSVG
jgi:hypothetical protein